MSEQNEDRNVEHTDAVSAFPELTEKDLADLEKMNAEFTPIDGTVLRPHEDDHEKCWCHKRYPLKAHGYEIGVAIPLTNGDYAMEFDDSNVSRLVQTFINMGAMNGMSIVGDEAIIDLGEDDEPDQEDPED